MKPPIQNLPVHVSLPDAKVIQRSALANKNAPEQTRNVSIRLAPRPPKKNSTFYVSLSELEQPNVRKAPPIPVVMQNATFYVSSSELDQHNTERTPSRNPAPQKKEVQANSSYSRRSSSTDSVSSSELSTASYYRTNSETSQKSALDFLRGEISGLRRANLATSQESGLGSFQSTELTAFEESQSTESDLHITLSALDLSGRNSTKPVDSQKRELRRTDLAPALLNSKEVAAVSKAEMNALLFFCSINNFDFATIDRIEILLRAIENKNKHVVSTLLNLGIKVDENLLSTLDRPGLMGIQKVFMNHLKNKENLSKDEKEKYAILTERCNNVFKNTVKIIKNSTATGKHKEEQLTSNKTDLFNELSGNTVVKSYSILQREKHTKDIVKNESGEYKLCLDESSFDTKGQKTKEYENSLAFVITLGGKMVANKHRDCVETREQEKSRAIHHSSLAGHKPVQAAGIIAAENGKITEVIPETGHYQTSAAAIYNAFFIRTELYRTFSKNCTIHIYNAVKRVYTPMSINDFKNKMEEKGSDGLMLWQRKFADKISKDKKYLEKCHERVRQDRKKHPDEYPAVSPLKGYQSEPLIAPGLRQERL
ncbi:uncharacterized protein RINTU1_15270 [Candidatus Regiella insecticola]|uniref:Uncharacterized protein n=2 Tax=Candidatus Regiella insecticola TaxID=138073 RepID=A0A6L2ZPA1_9ENTR|nr:uncharacterized protein RINTU1_15270 [Candidatus Regiella insecticola]